MSMTMKARRFMNAATCSQRWQGGSIFLVSLICMSASLLMLQDAIAQGLTFEYVGLYGDSCIWR